MRVLLAVGVLALLHLFAPELFSKATLVILVVGVLTTIGLVRVVTHESHAAAKELAPAAIEMVEAYFKVKMRVRELQAEFQRAHGEGGAPATAGGAVAEYQRGNRSG